MLISAQERRKRTKAGCRGCPAAACREGGGLTAWREMADGAVSAGLMMGELRPAALSLAAQIARLEARYAEYYRLGDQDAETLRAQSSPEALDRMGKCEKQLAELKARFFEITGLDRQYAARTRLAELQVRAAEKGGEVVLKLEGFDPAPASEQ